MAIHLVRHAHAGRRHSFGEPDGDRPLSPAGRAQAAEIAAHLVPLAPARILSSPLVRCVETVRPLADALGLEVEPTPALAEGVDIVRSWALLEAVGAEGGDAVLCTHGDVLPDILDRLLARGAAVEGGERGVVKGSVWAIDADPDGCPTAARLTFAPERAG